MTALPQDVVTDLRRRVADLEQKLQSGLAEREDAIAQQAATALENARLQDELRAGLDRQTASAEILRTIASTSGDAERSLQQIAETTARLFSGQSVRIRIAENNEWSRTISVGASAERIDAEVSAAQLKIGARNLPGTVLLENRQIHIPDLDNVDPGIADWPGLRPARAAGTRTMAGTPLRREGKAIGALIVYRDRLAPFTADELALLQSFADQAVIAIENARLFNETREALERQTATADILKVIASSPTDVQPVFEAIATSSNRLIGGFSTAVLRFIGDKLHLAAFTPTNAIADQALTASFPRPLAEFPPFLLVRNGETVEFADTESENVPQLNRDLARLRGYRSMLFTPLMSSGTPIGLISVTRKDPGKFAGHHIQLVRTFADQAVIAIENVRLFNETREALERQTATADILKIIASSPSDVQPVFEAIAERSNRLVEGLSTAVYSLVDDTLHLAAFTRADPAADAALQALFPRPLSAFTWGEKIRKGEIAHIPDVEVEWAALPSLRELAQLRGFRSLLLVPLLRNGTPIGLISVTRKELGTFADHHVQLLQTFADQAVIAIENVRLFDQVQARTRDLTEALQQQTATADVLKVISRSAFDLQTVLDTLVASASTLCSADQGMLLLFEDGVLKPLSYCGPHPEKFEFRKSLAAAPHRGTMSGRAVLEGRTAHVPDVLVDPEFTNNSWQELTGFRAMLAVPLMRQEQAIGAMALSRTTPGPFADRQIELVTTFADQAVIAIENVRLFDEVQARTEDLRESLQFQTATSDVLKVISSSPDSLQPVLDVIVDTARHLCGTETSTIFLLKDERFHIAAASGAMPEYLEFLRTNPIALDQPGSSTSRAAREKRTVHIPDIGADPEFGQGPMSVGQRRALLSVPLMREGTAIGVITMRQSHLTPFTERQIEVVQTFADQAVIAISNVRLFEEVQQRTEDLHESLQQQTATADVLKVISRSAFDLQIVLDTLVESAARLCEADMAAITRQKGDEYFRAGSYGFPPEFMDYVKDIPVKPERSSIMGRTLLEGKVIHVPDVHADPDYTFSEAQRLSGDPRTFLGVPLLREGRPVGALVLLRRSMRPFTDKQIELVTTFADQAVIAIENVRLFDEVQAKTRELEEALTYQTGSSNILGVIASSPTDVAPVLKATGESECELCRADDALVVLKDGDDLVFKAQHGSIPVVWQRQPISRQWASGRAVVDRKPIHGHDLLAPEGEEFPDAREFARRTNVRTVLSVPLLRENQSIGSIVLRRTDVQPFSDKQIALLQTFADQAVIALGNVRLFEEVQARTNDLQESLEYQTATSDVLQVISRSTFDLQPVLETLAKTAGGLCEADSALISNREGEAYRVAAAFSFSPQYDAFIRGRVLPAGRGSIAGRVALEGQVVHIADIASDPEYTMAETVTVGKFRTMLGVPLLREGIVIGTINLGRQRVQPFTDRQIELIRTFADQAVIAIENVRLFDEVQQRTRG